MEKTEEALGAFLKQKALESWEQESPYLLSSINPDLRTQEISYRDVIGDEETLKQFVTRTADAYGYKLVQHPLQKPKVGIIPADKEFTFGETLSVLPVAGRQHRGEGVLYSFLKALGKLPAADIDKVVIPTSILVKLARYR